MKYDKLPHAGLRRTMELREKGLCVNCGAEPLVTKNLGKLCRDAELKKRRAQYDASKKMLREQEKGGGA